MMIRIGLMLFFFVAAGCSGGNGGIDAGEDGAEEKTGDADGGDFGNDGSSDGDGGMRVDEDLGDDLGLMIPLGTCACGSTVASPLDQAGAVERKVRVCFWQDLHRLYKDKQSFETILIKSVEVGPWGEPATPVTRGIFTVSAPLQPDGEYTFEYQQDFEVGGVPIGISLRLGFHCQNYEPALKLLTLDDAALCNRLFMTSAKRGDMAISLGSCQYSLYSCGIVQFNLTKGFVLKVENCRYCPKDWLCKASYAGMRRAELTDDVGVFYLNDYFGLVHSMRHHDWGNDSLMVFYIPLASDLIVYIGTDEYPNHSNYSQATLMDDQFNLIENLDVLSVEYPGTW